MKINKLIFILITTLLTSCAAAVLVGAAGGLAVYDRRTVSMIERDARIFYIINTSIAKDPRFHGSRIVVTSYNQIVLLAGQTPLSSVRLLAEKIAQGTANVRRVHNELTIDNPIPLAQRSKDTLITAEARSKMLTKKGLESGSIRIVSENGVVYLMGIVTQEQANLAVNVARQIDGVNKVVKIFQYIT